MFQCDLSVLVCKSCICLNHIFEQTDHSDRSEDHHTSDLAEDHEYNAVPSDGHKQLGMQRQGITFLLTFTKEEGGKKNI